MKRALAAWLLSRTGLRSLLSGLRPWSGVIVLNYHRIGDGRDSVHDRGLWSATPESFAEQLRFCKSNLEMIVPDDLPRALAAGRGRYGLVTFDDGYRDNHDRAFPILQAEGVPATFFVSTGFIDARGLAWWDEIAWMVRNGRSGPLALPGWLASPVALDEPDRERAIRTLLRTAKSIPADAMDPFLEAIAVATGSGRSGASAGEGIWMTWDMLREMASAGMTIGGHGVTHAVLARASPERQRQEIQGCARRLADELGQPMRCFSYPVGARNAFDTVTRGLLEAVGVRFAFSYYGGFSRFADWDPLDVRRVAVEPELTTDWFRSIIALPRTFA